MVTVRLIFLLLILSSIGRAQENDSSRIFTKDSLNLCSFNIQFLGHYKAREDSLLADMLDQFDVVVIQEMVAPPVEGTFPDGTPYKKDNESASFTEEMVERGFSYWLSPEDTGPKKNHVNSTSSEWWITFYRSELIIPDSSTFYGFLDTVSVASTKYQRVPYAMPFMSAADSTHLFSLVSLHLKPGNSSADKEIRANELANLFQWTINHQDSSNFILLGDCNIYKAEEFMNYDSIGIYSLNDSCYNTNTKLYESVAKGKPYDHVFYSDHSAGRFTLDKFEVFDLMDYLKQTLPGDQFIYEPYDHDTFRTAFSDHLPVIFRVYY